MSWPQELSPREERAYWLAEIKRRTDAGYGMAVNCRYMPQLSQRPILRRLIEDGLVLRMREYRGRNSRRTILRTPIE